MFVRRIRAEQLTAGGVLRIGVDRHDRERLLGRPHPDVADDEVRRIDHDRLGPTRRRVRAHQQGREHVDPLGYQSATRLDAPIRGMPRGRPSGGGRLGVRQAVTDIHERLGRQPEVRTRTRE